MYEINQLDVFRRLIMRIQQTIFSIITIMIFGFGCGSSPMTSSNTGNILVYVFCGSKDKKNPIENVTVAISGKQANTASDGSIILSYIETGVLTLVTISGSGLTKTYKTNQKIKDKMEIEIPESVCPQVAKNPPHPPKKSPPEPPQKQYKVIFIEPQDSGILDAFGEPVTQSPCRGKIQGPDEPFGDLLVEVSIQTNKVYLQGTSRVSRDGSWEVPCNFGGNKHKVQADLLRGEEKLAEKAIIVQRVHR